MLGESWVYWAAFLVAALLVAAVPLVNWWEHRADEKDRETWAKRPGAR